MSATVDRRRRVAELHAAGLTLAEIGRRLGVSPQRVEQLLAAARANGLAATRAWVTAAELAADLGVSVYRVAGAAARAGVESLSARARRYDPRGATLIRATIARECAGCGRPLTPRQLKWCGNGCRERAVAAARAAEGADSPRAWALAHPAAEGRLHPGMYPLRAREALAGVEAGGEWVRLGAAARLAGVSKTRVGWLRYRGILAARRDPSGRRGRGGGAEWVYSAAQCRALAGIATEKEVDLS